MNINNEFFYVLDNTVTIVIAGYLLIVAIDDVITIDDIATIGHIATNE